MLNRYIREKLIPYSLTDSDVKKYCKNIKMYDEIKNYSSVNQLLGRENKVIILIPIESEVSGHWCCLFRNKRKELRYYDPYGKLPDHWLFNGTSKPKPYPYLSELLLNSGELIHYNEYPIQGDHSKIATCGRHVCLRLKFPELSDKEFYSCFGKKVTLSPDELVSLLI